MPTTQQHSEGSEASDDPFPAWAGQALESPACNRPRSLETIRVLSGGDRDVLHGVRLPRGDREKQSKIRYGAEGRLAAARRGSPQGAYGKACTHLIHIVAVLGIVGRQWKQQEPFETGHGKLVRQPRVSMLHHEHTNTPDQADFGVLRDNVSREVIPRVPVSQEVRIEADNQSVGGGRT